MSLGVASSCHLPSTTLVFVSSAYSASFLVFFSRLQDTPPISSPLGLVRICQNTDPYLSPPNQLSNQNTALINSTLPTNQIHQPIQAPARSTGPTSLVSTSLLTPSPNNLIGSTSFFNDISSSLHPLRSSLPILSSPLEAPVLEQPLTMEDSSKSNGEGGLSSGFYPWPTNERPEPLLLVPIGRLYARCTEERSQPTGGASMMGPPWDQIRLPVSRFERSRPILHQREDLLCDPSGDCTYG